DGGGAAPTDPDPTHPHTRAGATGALTNTEGWRENHSLQPPACGGCDYSGISATSAATVSPSSTPRKLGASPRMKRISEAVITGFSRHWPVSRSCQRSISMRPTTKTWLPLISALLTSPARPACGASLLPHTLTVNHDV